VNIRGDQHLVPTLEVGDKPGSTGLLSLPSKPKKPRRVERPCGFPAWRRLRNTRDFTRVERQGVRASGTLVAVTVRPGPGRVGLVVSKKVDNRASVRNLVKRRVRDLLRQEKPRYASRAAGTVDVVVTARAEAALASYADLRAEVLRVLDLALAKLKR
jgi:ribonuclease P protein component